MAIQDSDPERRNLMVTSIAFVVFFFAGGELADDIVRIQIINVKFQYPCVLAVIAWLMLFWFAYRYWLTHSGKFRDDFAKELILWSNKPYVRKYLEGRLSEPVVEDVEEGYHVQKIEWSGLFLFGHCRHAGNVKRNDAGQISSYTQTKPQNADGKIRFGDLKGLFVTVRILSKCFYLKPSFSNYIVPYILFFLAVAGGVWRAL